MPASPASARTMTIVRGALPWLVGVAVLTFRAPPFELVAPHSCPGLLDLSAIHTVLLRPDVPVGSVLGALQAAAAFAGSAVFVALALRATGSLGVAAVTGVAVGLGLLFPSALAPPWEAASFTVCAVIGLLVWRGLDRHVRRGPAFAFSVAAALLLASLVVPQWTVPAAAGVGLTAYLASPRLGRLGRVGLALACAVALGIVVPGFLGLLRPDQLMRPPVPYPVASCLQLRPAAGMVSRAIDLVRTATEVLGPLALALAALGAFAQARRAGRRGVRMLALVCASLVPAVLGPEEPRVLMAPLLVALWLLAALGLHETTRIAGERGAWSRVTVAFLLLLVPALQIARRHDLERHDRGRPMGHQQATLGQMRAVLNVVPPRTAFVEEDASFDVLLRAAAFGGRDALKPFSVVQRDRDAVRQALGEGPVRAFPLGQQALANRGFVVQPASVWRLRHDGSREVIGGLGAVTGVRPCHVLGRAWVDVADSLADGRIAVVADAERARGPVILFVGAPHAVRPRPDRWPARALGGFRTAGFDQSKGVRSALLARAAADSGLAGAQPVLAAPFVARLELLRTPRAPLVLPVVLGARLAAGVARVAGAAPAAGTLMLCDAPAVEVVPFGPRVGSLPTTRPSPAAAPRG